jgi:sugar/nucleoside kinase (ribokinase family)
MGRFIREQLAREGVEVGSVLTDPDRLTALSFSEFATASNSAILPRELRGHS